ncbi:slc25a25b [Symbiodinium sp. KB8]|nr:slc25a25b [Symbiodinium sp. KB8]
MSSSDGAEAAKPADFMARRLVAGAGAGIITKTCIAPLERAKILLQIQAMRGDPVRKYRGTVGTMRTVFVEEGVLGLWKGNFANVLRVMPVYALKFSFNDTFKSMVAGKSTEKLTFTQLMMSGTLAGLFQQLVTYPLETVRTRLSVGEGLGLKYRSIWECGKDLVQKEGALAL